MKVSDFTFDLPEELIAQDPLEDRSSSRLLTLDKNTGEIGHDVFHNIDGCNRAVGVDCCLTLRRAADEPLAAVGECHDGRRCALTLIVRNDGCVKIC